ncbi:hypothetical protein K2173_017304 [Erythroxylum novogranatense]|uniref:Uncharacterized protein n=1 Tax=Erythroxylum novogranatense TaxID=1862640 RepID=A0AAV8U9W3_9ROSI|nr:hypothetical protein K2173_017304 [Erythroxylum novogranatense]
MSGISVSPSSAIYSLHSKIPTPTNTSRYTFPRVSPKPGVSLLLDNMLGIKLGLGVGSPRKDYVRTIARGSTDDSSSGDSNDGNILDAFFLGKALAEALNERMESSVGELLSTVSKLQSGQQKQIQEFQADVLARAKKAKQNAAQDTTGAQELISTTADSTNADSSSSTGTTTSASTSGDETTTSTNETS